MLVFSRKWVILQAGFKAEYFTNKKFSSMADNLFICFTDSKCPPQIDLSRNE